MAYKKELLCAHSAFSWNTIRSHFSRREKRYITPFTLCGSIRKGGKRRRLGKKGKRQPPPLLQAYVHLYCSVPLYTQQRMECNNGTHNACVCASVVPAFFGRGKERDLLLLVYCFADIKLCRAKKGTHTAAECVDYLALV